MSELSHQTPLAGVEAPPALAVSLREVTGQGMIDLRGLATDAAFMKAARTALGIKLPVKPRTTATADDVTVLWLSVDQWLIVCPLGRVAEILAGLRAALQGIHSLAVDVSDMRAIIRIEGDGCREVLMKGTSLDLLSAGIVPGFCKRLRFAEIAALIHVVADDVIDVYVFRSYARYAWDFLCATAKDQARVRLFSQQPAPV